MSGSAQHSSGADVKPTESHQTQHQQQPGDNPYDNPYLRTTFGALSPLSFDLSPLAVDTYLDPQAFAPISTATNPMSTYFTTHHFAPHWTLPRHSSEREHHAVTTAIPNPPTAMPAAAPKGEHSAAAPGQHHIGLEALTHLLHALNVHYNASRGSPSSTSGVHGVVHPRFDLVESVTAYTIYGDVPGLSRDDVNVDVNDHLFSITISGTLKRPLPQDVGDNVAIAHKESVPVPAPEGTSDKPAEKKAAEAQNEEVGEGSNSKPVTVQEPATGATTTNEENKESDTGLHWHVTERHVGQFRRTFQLPVGLVDMGGVKAAIQNGLLTITVPRRPGSAEAVHRARAVEIQVPEILV